MSLMDVSVARMPASVFQAEVLEHPEVCHQLLTVPASKIHKLANSNNEFKNLNGKYRPASPSWSFLAGRSNGGARRLSVAHWRLPHAKAACARYLRMALFNCGKGAIANSLVRNSAPARVSPRRPADQ